jgi:hypothetical protein
VGAARRRRRGERRAGLADRSVDVHRPRRLEALRQLPVGLDPQAGGLARVHRRRRGRASPVAFAPGFVRMPASAGRYAAPASPGPAAPADPVMPLRHSEKTANTDARLPAGVRRRGALPPPGLRCRWSAARPSRRIRRRGPRRARSAGRWPRFRRARPIWATRTAATKRCWPPRRRRSSVPARAVGLLLRVLAAERLRAWQNRRPGRPARRSMTA